MGVVCPRARPAAAMSHSMSLTHSPDGLLATGGTAALTGPDADRVRKFSEHWPKAQRPVRAYLASFVPDGSLLDDCVQEVALVAWRKGPLDDGDQAFLHHTLACARHIGMAARRKFHGDRLKLLAPDVAQGLADAIAAAQPAPEPTDRVEALRHCIGKLSPDQQALIRLRYGDDSASELSKEAKRAGKNLLTLYKRLERLRGLLRDCVTRQLSPPA
jgi:DNA-directed RNA polymerase specialized sigma24 family protein